MIAPPGILHKHKHKSRMRVAGTMRTYRSRDRARGQEVPWPHVASCDAVVRQLLLHGPIQVSEVGLADDAGGLGAVGLNGHLELDVKVVAVLVSEVGQGRRVLLVVVDGEWGQGLHTHHPRRDAGDMIREVCLCSDTGLAQRILTHSEMFKLQS